MRLFLPIAVVVIGLSPSGPTLNLDSADLRPPTLQAWEGYDRAVHARVDAELQTVRPFLVLDRIPAADQRRAATSLAAGSVFITRLPGPNLKGPAPEIPDGMVHHWLGVVRIPRARLDDVLGFVQRYDDHARFFSDVVASKLIRRDGDDFEVFLKLRRQKVVTVFYNTTHLVSYRRLGPTHAASRSVTARIAELADAGGPSEREKPVGHDSGYLWRLNSYWRFVEINGGVTAECESISLSRDIPAVLSLFIGGIVDGIARESVEQTLDSIRKGVQKESMIPAK